MGLDEYPHDKNIEYLHSLKNVGVDTVFISSHMPEMNEYAMSELHSLVELAKKLNMKIILDVNGSSIKRYPVPKGIYSLRLDYGFNVNDIMELAKNDYLIELNASVIQKEELLFLLKQGIDITKFRISHNFYPKPYTGLSHEEVLDKNIFFKSLGMEVMAYVPSSFGKRPPIKEGLPTIENHRYAVLESCLADYSMLLIDEVCFGDAYASMDEFNRALNYEKDILSIPILVYKGLSKTQLDILNKVHTNRADANEYFVRSSYRTKEEIVEFNAIARERFMITIDNSNFMRYCGEVGIMKKSIGRDYRVNVVGVAQISDYLLDNIKPSQKFKFIIRGEI